MSIFCGRIHANAFDWNSNAIDYSWTKIDMHYDGAIVIETLEISISALAEVNLLLYDTEESHMVDVILLCQGLLTKAPTDTLAFYFI